MHSLLHEMSSLRRLSVTCLLFVAVGGCSSKHDSETTLATPARVASADGVDRKLAYQHSLQIDTDERRIAALFEAAQAACRDASIDLCTVLESRINTGQTASASLKFRAKPSGIRKLIAAIGNQGEITDQATVAEDLAAPIGDAAKKLAMLNDYRTKLETLRDRAGGEVDALIKVNRELAQVQSELEALAGKHAHLLQRVETEILSVVIRSDRNQSFWRPIGFAASTFGASLSQGVSIAISGTAYLIPWLLIFGGIGWSGRKLWRRRKRPH